MDWLKYEWIWEKNSGTGFLNAKKMPLKIHENVLVFYDKLPTYNPQGVIHLQEPKIHGPCKSARSSNYNYHSKAFKTDVVNYPTDVLKFPRDANAFHPTQKPVDLVRYLVRTYTNEGDLVLDNCMGSGTTAVACVLEGRNFIGFELNKEYYEKANERLRDLTGPFQLYGDIGVC